MEFLKFSGSESMGYEHALGDYEKFQKIMEEAYVKDCVLCPKDFCLVERQAAMGTNLHLEETGFKEGNSAASSIVLGITKTVQLVGSTGRTHRYSTCSQAKRKSE